jgi:hypothetical protein
MAPPPSRSQAPAVVPRWLADESTPQPLYAPPQYNPSSNGQYSSVPTTAAAEESSHKEDLVAAIPRMILYTRIINLALSIAMIMVSLLSLLTTQSATTGVLACYVVVFACLLCCFETHLKQVSKLIAMNFGFMYSAKSRSAFMIFIGETTVLWMLHRICDLSCISFSRNNNVFTQFVRKIDWYSHAGKCRLQYFHII